MDNGKNDHIKAIQVIIISIPTVVLTLLVVQEDICDAALIYIHSKYQFVSFLDS